MALGAYSFADKNEMLTQAGSRCLGWLMSQFNPPFGPCPIYRADENSF
jgi:hypothetical protein